MQLLHSAKPLKENDDFKKQPEVSSAEQLYINYAPFLFSIITKIIADSERAEETLVEVFLYLHKHLSDYNPGYNTFPVWLMNNARNIAVNNLCNMQQTYPCDKQFQNLPVAEKTVFALHYFRSLTVSQIAEVLHISTPIVEKLLRSAEVKAKH